ncbi:mitochondrial fission ELM1 family protein [Halomonas ventosae]|uniref:Mitochondrial fission protein ELM1 n=1 Tax=Halomonas ventosae TaxID=229007 RepID=A0A4R6HI33_9GAMM|nr:ELM1/GtrOC1 family putative glycosyltransferase [Halomonas ventosae]TDO07726.1 hypothetical protein DFO68_10891 [Halomonas ventosae]
MADVVPPPASRPITVMAASQPDHPPCLVLPALTQPETPRPPVRIFVGTEPAQIRAQRIFCYAIEQVRDVSREYRIYLMKNLSGFDRTQWRTGFTTYRYAVPEFAGCQGRAIYNDVGQLYLEDPALLFDLPMQAHGYLALSRRDTSVMLIDCARMAPWWNLACAQTLAKDTLEQLPTEEDLWGALDNSWNTRDSEYAHVQANLLDYTALHLQPWQPRPDVYSYHPHPLGDLWLERERAADREGYGPFNRSTPSPWFAAALAALDARPGLEGHFNPEADRLAQRLAIAHLGWCRPPSWRSAPEPLHAAEITAWPPSLAAPAPTQAYDGIAVTGVLEQLPVEDVPWLLENLANAARRLLYVAISLPATRDTPPTAPATHWWRRQLRIATHRYPQLAWHLDIRPDHSRQLLCTQSALTHAPSDQAPLPRVWLLLGGHHGDNAQLRLLARELGWPSEEKQLLYRYKPRKPAWQGRPSLNCLTPESAATLQPPWPDLVLGIGWRSVIVARWIKAQSHDHTQLIYLGRPRAPLHWFDLIVTTPQYGLPARDNIIHNLLPLNAGSPSLRKQAADAWRARFDALPHPWIGVLIGGSTALQRFDEADAAEMARAANRLARTRGGALLVTTSPRTPAAAASAFFAALEVPYHGYNWHDDRGANNPYPAYLDLCDAFVVSDDSASMLAEAIKTARPTFVYSLRASLVTRLNPFRQRLDSYLQGHTRETGSRGIPRQQDWKGRARDWAFTRGMLAVPRDLKRLSETLKVRGLLTELSGAENDVMRHLPLPDEMQATVEEIRRRLGERHWRQQADTRRLGG